MPDYELNFDKIQGNTTQHKLFNAYKEIAEKIGYDKDKINSIEDIKAIFESHNIKTDILQLDDKIEWENFESQPLFKLWHLLYSFEGDKSDIGNKNLIEKISSLCNMPYDFAKILANVQYENAYASLSSKAIKKILPHLISGEQYDIACVLAGYKTHSKDSLTKEQIKNKQLKDRLELLPRNSLRNPVVEKILNQMTNVVNEVIEVYGKPDEIRIEMARELKKSQKERKDLSDAIAKTTKEHEQYRKILCEEFGISNPTRNDILKYKLYLELSPNGFKTLYSDVEINPYELFDSNKYDIEHIIPKARLFDDSFSNKTIELKDVNRDKSDMTAYDYVAEKYGEERLAEYESRIEHLYKIIEISDFVGRCILPEERFCNDLFIDNALIHGEDIACSLRLISAEASRRMEHSRRDIPAGSGAEAVCA